MGRARLSVHPLGLLFPIVMLALGARAEAAALLAALAAHEGAHLLAARALGVGVARLRLMPFGGALELENPYALPPARLFAVAAAGPLANLLLLLSSAALAHWRVLSPIPALASLQVNGTLLLFNLLPALPLDGGRMLYALLAERTGREKAVAIGIRAGRAVAGLLVAAAVYGLVARGRFNLSFALAAVFILASARDEREALSGARLKAVLGALAPPGPPRRASLWAVSGDCDVRRALRVARADSVTLYAVYDGSRLSSFTDDGRLLNAAAERGWETPVSEAT